MRNKRLPSVMKHDFSEVPAATIQRSSFDRSSGLKTTFDAGYLVPFFVDEVLPGDTFSMQENFLARMSTPIFPLMDNIRMDTQYFFVPLRLVWDNWQKFCGEQRNPTDSTDFITPVMKAPTTNGYSVGSIHDYFGLPTGIPGYEHISFFHRAYNLIWNEYYRDQNLQDSVDVPVDDGPDDPTKFKLLKRGKRHDYFTSCLPWPQKGPSVAIPLGGRMPVHGIAIPQYQNGSSTQPVSEFTSRATSLSKSGGLNSDFGQYYGPDGRFSPLVSSSGTNPTPGVEGDYTMQGMIPYWHGVSTGDVVGTTQYSVTPEFNKDNWPIYVDGGTSIPFTINSLRQAFQIQRLLERDARGGTRYIEILKNHFRVSSPDARLQRPEFLGGTSTPVSIAPVAQTSSSDATSPQGNLAAYGQSSSSRHVFSKSFVEHGVIIGLLSVRADLTYQQGLDRMWSRRTRWDFYWPALSHLGEQAVLNKEIYCQGNDFDDQVFGYQERFAEYRYKTSKITGQFRSSFAQSLDSWHLSQYFTSLPKLNASFIEENPPMERVLAVTDYPQFLLDGWFKLRCARPMPVYSVPGFMDHF